MDEKRRSERLDDGGISVPDLTDLNPRRNSTPMERPILRRSNSVEIPRKRGGTMISQSVIETAIENADMLLGFQIAEPMVVETKHHEFILTPYVEEDRDRDVEGDGDVVAQIVVPSPLEERETEPLLAPRVAITTIKRDKLTTLIGILYALAGGTSASFTLFLTKSWYVLLT
jgi:hypothetical protein